MPEQIDLSNVEVYADQVTIEDMEMLEAWGNGQVKITALVDFFDRATSLKAEWLRKQSVTRLREIVGAVGEAMGRAVAAARPSPQSGGD